MLRTVKSDYDFRRRAELFSFGSFGYGKSHKSPRCKFALRVEGGVNTTRTTVCHQLLIPLLTGSQMMCRLHAVTPAADNGYIERRTATLDWDSIFFAGLQTAVDTRHQLSLGEWSHFSTFFIMRAAFPACVQCICVWYYFCASFATGMKLKV